MDKYNHIPKEMRSLSQWVCFDISEDGRKVPYTPGADSMAASNRSRDWRSFRAALKDVEAGKRQHIGFCFSSSDPFVFIDLDDPNDEDQHRVFERLNSYSQRSVSGEGVHIICRGNFQGSGKHPTSPNAGLFKENRFCLMAPDAAIENRGTINEIPENELQTLHSWLGGGQAERANVPLVEYQPEIPDQTIFEMGCDRYAKFAALCNGEWQQFEEYHNDHSTADHAFIAMLCDLTESNEQVRWFFGHSGMWNAERAAKKAGHGLVGYVDRTIAKIRGKQAHEQDIASKIQICFDEEESELPDTVPLTTKLTGACDMIDEIPDGLLKDLCKYSYQTAYLPLQESSIVGPLTLISGIIGRAFVTPTGAGLNQWIVIVGKTGCGKDEVQKSIKRILSGVSAQVPKIRRIFGGELVSGPSIETVFQDTMRYVSFFREFGKTFVTLTSPHAQEHTRSLVGAMLNSYNAADLGGSLEGRRKAKNEGEKLIIERPCLCILGDSTPRIYGAVSTRELASGFLQRFILVNVADESWTMVANPNAGAPLPRELAERLAAVIQMTEIFDARDGAKPTRVKAALRASKMMEEYALDKRTMIRNGTGPLHSDEVFNRAGLKVIRLATTVGILADVHSPLIEVPHVEWAIKFVERADNDMLAKFKTGEVGSGQIKQEAEILAAAVALASMKIKERKALGMPDKVAPVKGLIPLSLLKSRVVQSSAFAEDRLGAVTAFERCVASMVKTGVFTQIETVTAADTYDWYHRGTLLHLQK